MNSKYYIIYALFMSIITPIAAQFEADCYGEERTITTDWRRSESNNTWD